MIGVGIKLPEKKVLNVQANDKHVPPPSCAERINSYFYLFSLFTNNYFIIFFLFILFLINITLFYIYYLNNIIILLCMNIILTVIVIIIIFIRVKVDSRSTGKFENSIATSCFPPKAHVPLLLLPSLKASSVHSIGYSISLPFR